MDRVFGLSPRSPLLMHQICGPDKVLVPFNERLTPGQLLIHTYLVRESRGGYRSLALQIKGTELFVLVSHLEADPGLAFAVYEFSNDWPGLYGRTRDEVLLTIARALSRNGLWSGSIPAGGQVPFGIAKLCALT